MRSVKIRGKKYVLIPVKKYKKIALFIKDAKRKKELAEKAIKRLKRIVEEQNETVVEIGGLRIMTKRQNRFLFKRDLIIDALRVKFAKLKEKEKRMRAFLQPILDELNKFDGFASIWQTDKKKLERILAYEPQPKKIEMIVRNRKKRGGKK